jgi:hypothetical protein
VIDCSIQLPPPSPQPATSTNPPTAHAAAPPPGPNGTPASQSPLAPSPHPPSPPPTAPARGPRPLSGASGRAGARFAGRPNALRGQWRGLAPAGVRAFWSPAPPGSCGISPVRGWVGVLGGEVLGWFGAYGGVGGRCVCGVVGGGGRVLCAHPTRRRPSSKVRKSIRLIRSLHKRTNTQNQPPTSNPCASRFWLSTSPSSSSTRA